MKEVSCWIKETARLIKWKQRQTEHCIRSAKKERSVQEIKSIPENCDEVSLCESFPETYPITEASAANTFSTDTPSTLTTNRNTLPLPTVGKVCDRYGLSIHSAAAIAEDLQIMAKDNSLEIDDFPCHTQAVERCVKLVTEASQCVTNAASRDGLIRTRLKSRAGMLNFDQKNVFKF